MRGRLTTEHNEKISQDEVILKNIESRVPDFETFENRIITHVGSDYFPLIYQCLYERIMPSNSDRFSTEDFKKLLRDNNYLYLLNDIYRTRLSKEAFDIILCYLDTVENFNDYEKVLEKFMSCDPKGDRRVNAFSLGTKVLHTYNPEENPILDSVVRESLEIYDEMDIKLCLNFKKAMNDFVNDHKEYFSINNSDKIRNQFKKCMLKINFPKMKLLDMALY